MGTFINNPPTALPPKFFIEANAFNPIEATNIDYGLFSVLSYAGGAVQRACATLTLPNQYEGKQLKFTLYWVEINAENAKNVYWVVDYEATVPETGTCPTSPLANNTGTNLIDGTFNGVGKLHTISSTTSAKTFHSGDLIVIDVKREGADGSDTSVSAQGLIGILVEAV